MKISIVQDAIIVVSALTQEQFAKATRFIPDALTLFKKNEDSKKEPVCVIAYGECGDINANGIVFDSVTEDGKLCLTMAGSLGNGPQLTAEEKKQIIAEKYASLILKVNELEEQVLKALDAKAEEIARATASVETISI